MNAKKVSAKKTEQSLNTWIKLARAFSTINRKSIDALRVHKITQPQFLVIEALGHLGPLKVGELCEKMLVSGGNMTLVLDNLEKSNYIERVNNKDDRRSLIVKLTKDGKKVFDKVFPKQAEYITEMMSVLTNDELKNLGDICKKLGLTIQESEK
ncbi:MAG: MarR family winged helix-turn-helix transcriptional regulator [Rhodothermaceae bacterium]